MGRRLRNASAVLNDPKARGIMIVIVFIALIGIAISYIHFKRFGQKGALPAAQLAGAPSISSIPGVGNPSREYVKLVEQQNIAESTAALKAGTAAVPTLTRPTYLDSSALGSQLEKAGISGCSSEDLTHARSAGVTAAELRCRGCSLAALKDAGYTAGELLAAGFNAKQLKDAGYSTSELKAAGFSAKELAAAGYTAKEMADAGYTAAELKDSGFSDNELKNANIDQSAFATTAKHSCDVNSLIKARAQGITATALRNSGCDAMSLKAAGFTAAELRAAGYTAKELKDAGYSAAELKAAGFTAQELRQAGFSPKELKEAGYSAANPRKAGYSAGELAQAGYSTKELRDAGFSAQDLKNGGVLSKDLKNAGFTAEELKKAGFTDGDLVRGGFSIAIAPTQALPKEMQGKEATATATAAAPSEEAQALGKPTSATTETPDWQKKIEEIQKEQDAQMTEQQLQDKMKQTQQNMMSQASALFSSWGVTNVRQQYAVGTPAPEKGVGAASGAGAGSRESGGASGDVTVYKAGTILFAVLNTGINSDEPSPIMATIASGDLKGAKVLGSFQRVDQKVVLQFNMLSVPELTNSVAINAVAIDANTARTAMASSVDNHYLLRYGTTFASAFMSGIGQAIQTSGSSTQTTSAGTQTNFFPQLDTTQQVMVGLGNVGQQFGTSLGSLQNTPPTVKVASGAGIGVLLMADLSVPVVKSKE